MLSAQCTQVQRDNKAAELAGLIRGFQSNCYMMEAPKDQKGQIRRMDGYYSFNVFVIVLAFFVVFLLSSSRFLREDP